MQQPAKYTSIKKSWESIQRVCTYSTIQARDEITVHLRFVKQVQQRYYKAHKSEKPKMNVSTLVQKCQSRSSK